MTASLAKLKCFFTCQNFFICKSNLFKQIKSLIGTEFTIYIAFSLTTADYVQHSTKGRLYIYT